MRTHTTQRVRDHGKFAKSKIANVPRVANDVPRVMRSVPRVVKGVPCVVIDAPYVRDYS